MFIPFILPKQKTNKQKLNRKKKVTFVQNQKRKNPSKYSIADEL